MAKYDLNEQEVGALKELINIAVKAAGLSVAEVGIVLVKKLSSPIKDEPIKEQEEAK